MRISLRPVSRPGQAPARPPLALLGAALVAALALTGVDVAHQLRAAQSARRNPIAAPAATPAAPARDQVVARAWARPAATTQPAARVRPMDTAS